MICCWRCWTHIGSAPWAKWQGPGLIECRLHLLQPPQTQTPSPPSSITAATRHLLQMFSPTHRTLTRAPAHKTTAIYPVRGRKGGRKGGREGEERGRQGNRKGRWREGEGERGRGWRECGRSGVGVGVGGDPVVSIFFF